MKIPLSFGLILNWPLELPIWKFWPEVREIAKFVLPSQVCQFCLTESHFTHPHDFFNKINFKVKFNFLKIHFLGLLLNLILLSLYLFLIISLTWFNYLSNRAIWNWFSYQYFLSFVLPNNHSMAVFGWKYWKSKRGWASVGSGWFWREWSRLTILALLLGDWGLTRGGCSWVDLGHDD